jgi:hypothetical protein
LKHFLRRSSFSLEARRRVQMRFKVQSGAFATIGLVVTFAAVSLALSATALGDNRNARLCTSDWQQLQSESGGSFASLADCASSHGVFEPSVTVTHPSEQVIIIEGEGFHASTTIVFVIGLDHPVQAFFGVTDPNGGFVLTLPFSGCFDPTVHFDLTVTVTDSFGVHASARLPGLC